MGGECGLFNMLGKQCQRSDSGKSQDYTDHAQAMQNATTLSSHERLESLYTLYIKRHSIVRAPNVAILSNFELYQSLYTLNFTKYFEEKIIVKPIKKVYA